jgi:hypothetical protein
MKISPHLKIEPGLTLMSGVTGPSPLTGGAHGCLALQPCHGYRLVRSVLESGDLAICRPPGWLYYIFLAME